MRANPALASSPNSERESAYSYTPSEPVSGSGAMSSSYCSYAHEHRPAGVVGTLRYMAPEVLALFASKEDRGKVRGCTPALDWFSYGVIVHEMLTGKFPYNPMRGLSYNKLAQMYSTYLRVAGNDVCAVHKSFMGNFEPTEQSAELMGEAGVDIVTQLVERHPLMRLGLNKSCRDTGDIYSEFKSHPFFEDVDWCAVENRQIAPPVEVGAEQNYCTGPAQSLEEVLASSQREHWCESYEPSGVENRAGGMQLLPDKLLLDDDSQQLFSLWDFTHPNVIEEEIKIG